ncbi:MAG: gamma-glutamyl-gamma-aminobutyrate hydrolase family protein [Bacteroidota bacterium]|nr:gamma-glutamyl-gamma-aminobutyrate hydrolase family protein [Bacteroidota bacterium]
MKIAVTDNGNEGKRKLYLDWLSSFNPQAEIVVLSHDTHVPEEVKQFDGLLLTGGEDVAPEKSKATPVELVGKPNIQRDEFEFGILDLALNRQIPILGICRGLQVTNVYFGGTLVADLHHAGFSKHTTGANEPENRHSIRAVDDTLLSKIAGRSGEINSYHHQAADKIADDLMVSGHSSDNVVEALEWKHKNHKPFLLLVQWHPERMKDSGNLFALSIGKIFFNEIHKAISVKTFTTQ